MIAYGFSQQGRSHIKSGVVCQDSHRIDITEQGWRILVVADGVGSAKHSEDGSRIAAEIVAEYCKKNIRNEILDSQIIEVLKEAFHTAFQNVQDFSREMNGAIEDYDTTLTAAIYTGKEVYYGHAGDGGIIVKDVSGHYDMITTPQKGLDGISVRPLRAGAASWDFGKYNKEVSALLLATDGMLDTLLPPLLNIGQVQLNPMFEVDKKMNVYVTLAEFFMNPYSVYMNKEIGTPDQFMESFLAGDVSADKFNNCIFNAYKAMYDVNIAKAICDTVQKYNYSTWKMEHVTDDRTIVCAIRKGAVQTMESPDYYAEPDWKSLQKRYDQLAYPSLFEQENIDQLTEYQKLQLDIIPDNNKEKRSKKTLFKKYCLIAIVIIIAVVVAIIGFLLREKKQKNPSSDNSETVTREVSNTEYYLQKKQ